MWEPATERSDAPAARWRPAAAVALLFAAAMAQRLSVFGGSWLPLSDGALFVVFIEALAAGGGFPACIDFNGHCLPFAYPPLSFLIGAGLVRLGADPLLFAAWYPFLMTTLYSAAVLLLLRRLLARDLLFVLAAAVFLFVTRSFEFLMMGGGISRATGALCFALALLAAERARRRGGWLLPGLAGLAVGGAILSHLEWGIAGAFAVSLVMLYRSPRPGHDFLRLCLAGTVAALAIAPWAATVLGIHGTAPFDHAAGTSSWLGLGQFFAPLTLKIAPALLVLPFVAGMAAALWHRQWFWPALLFGFLALTPRQFDTVAVLPQAVLVALGVVAGIDRLVRAVSPDRHVPPWAVPPGPAGPPRRALGLAAAAIFVGILLAISVVLSPPGRNLEQATPDYLEATAWARETLPPGRRFVVISGEAWQVDEVAEWFPYYSGHVGVNIVQGTEWLPDRAFARTVALTRAINGAQGCRALHRAMAPIVPPASHVLDASGTGCFDDPARFGRIFGNGSVEIFRILPAPPGSAAAS
ncbi:hypothetical protein LNKW23_38480 [Paralimibaculum aggregatum]|uniref:Glycosyltransferase RgtA/B/C/D-like domain-containing protein n=1 Tax=Paralimibaculum aggregatum TaxID=3036245 RepID=A0ABQ6LN51_9RHOB|nr:hypothetical protein [Limibaculum sp. NKW23]GMG84632.1 hypothetical protein LNKW23_38480 [Limibaculum sp. NKW23]